MTLTTIILGVIAVVLFIINSRKTGKQYKGLKSGLKQCLQTAPIIIGAFILAGMIEVLIPKEFVQNWLSREAGIKGVILGSFGGMLLAVGPYAFFPIASSILVSGAGLGTIVSMITGWCLLGLSKMPYETAFLGIRFYIKKFLLSIPLSLLSGFAAFILEIIIF